MPIPFILGAAAVVAAATGIGAGVYGASKIKEAKDTMESAQNRHERNVYRYEKTQEACTAEMDRLDTLEKEITNSFKCFSDLIARIHNRPKFEEIDFGDRSLPRYDPQHLREVSLGAGELLTLGVGLMVGGAIIFAFTGSKLSEKADEAWDQMKRAEEKIDTVCVFLDELKDAAVVYRDALEKIRRLYTSHMAFLEALLEERMDWDSFSETEKLHVRNLVHLVSVLNDMCKEKLVLRDEKEENLNTLNEVGIREQMTRAEEILDQIPPL